MTFTCGRFGLMSEIHHCSVGKWNMLMEIEQHCWIMKITCPLPQVGGEGGFNQNKTHSFFELA